MSVQTAADQKLEEARSSVLVAYNALLSIVMDECDGSAEFSQEMSHRIRHGFEMLKETHFVLKSPR